MAQTCFKTHTEYIKICENHSKCPSPKKNLKNFLKIFPSNFFRKWCKTKFHAMKMKSGPSVILPLPTLKIG